MPISSASSSIPNADHVRGGFYVTSSRPTDPPTSLRLIRGDQFAVALYFAKACLLLVPVNVPHEPSRKEVALERVFLRVLDNAEIVDGGIKFGILEHVVWYRSRVASELARAAKNKGIL